MQSHRTHRSGQATKPQHGVWAILRTNSALVAMVFLLLLTSLSIYLQLLHDTPLCDDHSVQGKETGSNMGQKALLLRDFKQKPRGITTREISAKAAARVSSAAATTRITEVDNNAEDNNNNNKPILIWASMRGDFTRTFPCDVPCEYTQDRNRRKNADASVYSRRGYLPPEPGDKFSIYMQLEGEHYYPIQLDRYHLENSYNWRSPLLKPYFEWVHYQGQSYIQNSPVLWNETIDGASFIARNCRSRNNREAVVKGLIKAGIDVHALSLCLHNKKPPQSINKIQMMKPYKFNLAFENGNVSDYVTEKVYQALAAGVVPVYLGAPNIAEFVPDGSIINVADFASTDALAEHLKECMNNETLYNSYHSWRGRRLPQWFEEKFNFTTATTECRTCRYIHAMQNGLEWDKVNQQGVLPRTS